MYFFGADPGSKNFAVSVVKAVPNDGQLRFKLCGTNMLPRTLSNLTGDVTGNLNKYLSALRHIRDEWNPVAARLERFQSRGLGGTTIETINFMLGSSVGVFRKQDLAFITAATWKNWANRYIDLKGAYKEYGLTSKAKSYSGIRDHELDATLIALYCATSYYGISHFEFFARVPLDDFIGRLQETTRLSLPEL